MKWDWHNIGICAGLLICLWLIKEVNQNVWEICMGLIFGDWLFRVFTPLYSFSQADYHFKRFTDHVRHLIGGYNGKL